MILLTDEEIESVIGIMLYKNCYLLNEQVKLARVGMCLRIQAKKIYEWGNETCPHEHAFEFMKSEWLKRECSFCWQELQEASK